MARTLERLHRLLFICLGLMLLGLVGCHTLPEKRATDLHSNRELPLGTAVENAVHYEILPEQSDIRFLVFRAGTLAKLGHNSVDRSGIGAGRYSEHQNARYQARILVPTAIEYQRVPLVVTASFTVKQSDFGIVPMRVLGGALQVDDPVKERMRIVAIRREPSPASSSESNRSDATYWGRRDRSAFQADYIPSVFELDNVTKNLMA